MPNLISHFRIRSLRSASLWAMLATALLVLLAPGIARAEEKPIKFRGVEDAIFVDGE